MMNKKLAIIFLIVCCNCLRSKAQVKLPTLIKDSMILQRDATVKVWGWASANEKVTVQLKNKKYATKANAEGNWQVSLPPTKAGGPYTMNIVASNKITITEILFGDVWFCSGQSNMEHQMSLHDVTNATEIATANYPFIRQFWVPKLSNLQSPQKDVAMSGWKAAIGDNIRPFSAVAYFFAKQLYLKYQIPIGIINASYGGTPIEAWTSENGLKDFSQIIATVQKNKDTAYINNLNKPSITNNNSLKQPTDAGLTGTLKWYDPNYQPKAWHNINIPGYWEDQGVKDLNGVVWYRKVINIPTSMIGKAAKVFLGRIVDADELYINGKQVGSTYYQYPQRRYALPNGLLKAGNNAFVIRITNNGGKGGFVPDKPYYLFAGADTIDLKGTWQYKVGEVFVPNNSGGMGGGILIQNQPTALYNAMVAPTINYTIKGICWYQGESNSGKPNEYTQLLPALINDWRGKWQLGNLPFLYVQLPGFMDYNYLPTESNWAQMREAQLKTLSVNNTAMAVAIELGEWNDIHPDNKQDVGNRLAIAAQKIAYHENIVYAGPIYKLATIEGDKIILNFTNIGSGLTTNDGEAPAEFAIAGADKKFVWAKAKIENNSIIVWNDAIAHPLYVRYAWADNPVNPNLYNKEGLPASPFRTDK